MAKIFSETNWKRNLINFRSNPRHFLNTNKLDEATFVIDVLQAVCDDSSSDAFQIQLILILHEFSEHLYTEHAMVEQVVASLHDIFEQQTTSVAVQKQILLTNTALCVLYNFLECHPAPLVDLLELLLGLTCDVNAASRPELRAAAAACLTELETNYPGLLLEKLEYLNQLVALERSWLYQPCVVLFTRTLADAVSILSHQHSLPDSVLTELLTKRTKPLKPFLVPLACSAVAQHGPKPLSSSSSRLPDNVDTSVLCECVRQVLSRLHLLTAPATVAVVDCVRRILETAPGIPAQIVEPTVLTMMRSSDISVQHMTLSLLRTFTTHFPEQTALFSRILVSAVSHLGLLPGQRILIAQWLQTWHDELSSGSGSFPPPLSSAAGVARMFPTVYDGTDTQLNKIRLLAACIPDSVPSAVVSESLLCALVPLQKSVSYGQLGKPAAALYGALYRLLAERPDPTLTSKVTCMLVTLVNMQPRLTPHTLDLLQAAQTTTEANSSLVHKVLEDLAKQIVDKLTAPSRLELKYYLAVLQYAAQYAAVEPGRVCEYVRGLLLDGDVVSGGGCERWAAGGWLLDVCAALMASPHTKHRHTELAELLQSVVAAFEGDVDVQDRARFLYSLLAQLEHDKLSLVLGDHSLSTAAASSVAPHRVVSGSGVVVDDTNTMATATSMMMSSASAAVSVTTLQTSPIDVQRIPFIADSSEDTQHQDSVCLKLKLSLCSKDYDSIYAVLLKFRGGEMYYPIEDVTLPSLHKSVSAEENDEVVTVRVSPREATATTMHISALFTSECGQMLACELGSVHLAIQDLFLPLTASLWWQQTTEGKQQTDGKNPQHKDSTADRGSSPTKALDVEISDTGKSCGESIDGAMDLEKHMSEIDIVREKRNSCQEDERSCQTVGDNVVQEAGSLEKDDVDLYVESRRAVFGDFWDTLSADDVDPALTLVCIDSTSADFTDVLETNLGRFRIKPNGASDSDEAHLGTFAAFVLPDSHLLLHFSSVNQQVFVTVATDNEHLLPPVTNHLKRLGQL